MPELMPVKTPLLDTLANHWNLGFQKSSESTLEKIKKRARSKYLTNRFILSLIDLKSPLEKGYWNTFYCNQVLSQEGKKIIGKYCGNRWCHECNRIRTAKLINGYKPVVENFKDPMYTVLTVKNVSCDVQVLRGKVKEMNGEFRKIIDLIRKRDGVYIEAIRTIEVTYNLKTDEFHPHFNIIVNGKENAKMIIYEWLKHFPDKEVNLGGQCMKKADSGTLSELFKYVVKFDKKNPPAATDIIFQALAGIKITSPTGVKRVPEEVEELISTEIPELEPADRLWWWSATDKDWITKNCWPQKEGVKLCSFIAKSIKLKSRSP